MQVLPSYTIQNRNLFFGARISQPRNMNSGIINDILESKISQHFVPTPNNVIEMMLKEIGEIKPTDKILEPSAGYGHIADMIVKNSALTPNKIDVIEPVEKLRKVLYTKGYNLVDYDILKYQPKEKYDKILMNPPFDNGSDIIHLMYCFDLLKKGGKIVSIMPENSFLPIRQHGYEKWVKDWLGNGEQREINEYLKILLENNPSKTIKLGNVFENSDVPDDVLTRLVVITKK